MTDYKVFTRFNNRPTEATPSGEKEEMTFRLEIDDYGHKSIVPDKPINVYDKIQSYKDECDIKAIVERALAGDETALNQRTGTYMDITGAPESMADAMRKIKAAEDAFGKMPKEIREKFNNSAAEYIAQLGSKEWIEKMGIAEEKILTVEPETIEKEVKNVEQKQ